MLSKRRGNQSRRLSVDVPFPASWPAKSLLGIWIPVLCRKRPHRIPGSVTTIGVAGVRLLPFLQSAFPGICRTLLLTALLFIRLSLMTLATSVNGQSCQRKSPRVRRSVGRIYVANIHLALIDIFGKDNVSSEIFDHMNSNRSKQLTRSIWSLYLTFLTLDE